jgi:uncharacterized protein (TIGR03086 family)
MSEAEVFVLADRELNKVIQQIKDDQWDMEMPPSFVRRGQDKVSLRQIVNYHAYDEAWVPDILAGKTMEEVGKDKFDGDLLGDDPKGNFAALVEKACQAAKNSDDPDRIVHLTYGDFPAREYLTHITWFRGSRVRDIAEVIGVNSKLSPELVQGLWDELSPHADEWRKMGVFGPEVKVAADADLETKLWALTGRRV